MSSLLDQLSDPASWQAYLEYKQARDQLAKPDLASLSELIESQAYLPTALMIQCGEALPPPQKILINKLGTAKKRTVYCFQPEVMWTLKHLAWLLYAFDDQQPEGCYSFRRFYGTHQAFKNIVRTANIDRYWCCKLDISNYFNSIPVAKMLPIVNFALAVDPALCSFFQQLLTQDSAILNGILISEQRGVMAGTPTSPFLANLYLRELDAWFTEQHYPYARYSDDIIFFAESEQEIYRCQAEALLIIQAHGLLVNSQKAYIAAPGEAWEFLGMTYQAGVIDLSAGTKAKLKGKIRRKARALRRWALRKQAGEWSEQVEGGELGERSEQRGVRVEQRSESSKRSEHPKRAQQGEQSELVKRAERAFIHSFNRKFFDSRNSHDLTWARWFFPLLTTSRGIHEIDLYLQQYVRYIATGRFNSNNYQLEYRQIKELGYRSLVNEYYRSRKLLAGE